MLQFLKSKLKFKLVSLTLTIFLVANIVLVGTLCLQKKTAQALEPVSIVNWQMNIPQVQQNFWEKAWEATKSAREWANDAYESAGVWITATIELAKQSDSWIAKAVRIAAYILMHQILNMMTNDIINWINGGGKPRFVSDWKGFLQTAADRAAGAFLNQLAGINLCEPFSLDLQIALMPTTNFPEEVSCSFSEMGQFFDDFRNEGWKGWAKLTSPENNFYGAYFKGIDQRMSAEAAAEKAAENEGIASKGFLGVRCTAEMATGGKCKAGEIITPGDAISYTTNNAINQPMEDLSRSMADMTDSLGTFAPYVIAIGNALINRVIKEGLAMVIDDDDVITNPRTYINIPKPDASTFTQMTNDKSLTGSLTKQQGLYIDTINNDILPILREQSTVLSQTESAEKQIMDTIVKATEDENCNLTAPYTLVPNPAKGTITEVSDSGKTITIITPSILTVVNVGKADVEVKSITTENEDGVETTTTNTITAYYPQTSNKITKLQKEINKNLALINSLNTAKDAVDVYVEWLGIYDDDLSLTQAEIDALTDEKQKEIEDLKLKRNELRYEAVKFSQDVVNSTAADFNILAQDTQKVNLATSQEIVTLKIELGISSAGIETGLYKNLADAKKILENASNQLSECLEIVSE